MWLIRSSCNLWSFGQSKCMDGREAMASYYMQRGMGGSGSGTQTGLPGQGGIRPPLQPGGSVGSTFTVESSPRAAIPPHTVNVGGGPLATLPSAEPVVKRKRGRPRKYGPDGTVSLALSPTPSSTAGSVLGIGSGSSTPLQKRSRGRPPGSGRKQQLASLGKCFQIIHSVACLLFQDSCQLNLMNVCNKA